MPRSRCDEQTPDGGRPAPTQAAAAEAAGRCRAAAGDTAAAQPPSRCRPAATDDDEPPPELVWYVLKVQSSREDTIRDALQRRVKIQGLQRFFGQIVVPTEKITEIRNNKKRIVERKTYPGYIMVQMELNEKTWFVVRETPGVGDFVGAHGTPTKMTDDRSQPDAPPGGGKDHRRDAQGPDRRRARRSRQDQGRTVRELRGDRRGGHRGPRAGQGDADHLQPAHAGRPRILAGGTDLTTNRKACDTDNETIARIDDGQGDDGESEAPVPRRAGDARPRRSARRWASTGSISVSS